MTSSTPIDPRAGRGLPHIRVLHSLAKPDGTTKFVDQITQGAPDDVEIAYFSWREALRGRYDVLHVHWPELLLRARTRRMRWAKRAALSALLLRLRLTHTPIVRTLHNVEPHESGGRIEQRILRLLDARTTLFVRLNPTTERPTSASRQAPLVTVLHGHYRDVFSAHTRTKPVPGALLYFGIIRPYKNVEGLLEAFRQVDGGGLTLRVVGSPSAGLREPIEHAAALDPRVGLRLAFVPDHDLVAEITAATLVVLPYTEMHNSGAMLVALSLDRPVLAPWTAVNQALADEVGEKWLTLYRGALTTEVLVSGLADAEALIGTDRPRLDGRDWKRSGEAHRDAYALALGVGRDS